MLAIEAPVVLFDAPTAALTGDEVEFLRREVSLPQRSAKQRWLRSASLPRK
jgi:hypothetical protein